MTDAAPERSEEVVLSRSHLLGKPARTQHRYVHATEDHAVLTIRPSRLCIIRHGVTYLKCGFTEKCLENPCTSPGEVCDVVDGEARCKCVDCHHEEIDPVCGLVGDEKATHPNLCTLKRRACKEGTTYTMLYHGRCKGEYWYRVFDTATRLLLIFNILPFCIRQSCTGTNQLQRDARSSSRD